MNFYSSRIAFFEVAEDVCESADVYSFICVA